LTKKDIVRTISEETGLTQQQTKDVVQRTFDAIVECLASGRRIELRNFGVFEVKRRAARTARNPRTGVQVEVPEKFVVTFKPGKEMEARVNQPADNKPPANSPLFPPDWTAKNRTEGSAKLPPDQAGPQGSRDP
jgi:integration host factor subunit beta